MKKIIIIILFCAVLIPFYYQIASGIPAFARKYQTSCNTCHTVYPQLNAFGESFRINGYQFQKDDEEKIKEKQVELGSEAYKRVWPDAVWPSFMPGSSPFSIRGRTAFAISTDTAGQTTSEFGMPALQFYGAGVLGKDISIWVGAHLFENNEPGSIDNFFVKFDNLFTDYLPEQLLYVKVGQFIPELVPFATLHRSLVESPYAFNTYDPSMGRGFVAGHVHGAGPFGIEKFQLGLELSGLVDGKLRYVAGIVNGNGVAADNNSGKDLYGRLAFKFGGLGFDGVAGDGAASQDSSNNLGETSFTLGAFGYKGIGTSGGSTDYDFYRAGGDINFQYKKLSIVGGYISGSNGVFDDMKYTLYFGEAQYMIYPWLLGIFRYEQANPKSLESFKQFVVHFSSLIVANVKVKLETRLNPDKMERYNMFLGLDFAF